MLVNQAVHRIPPQQTVLRDLSNRRIAFDWNIQESTERQFAQARKAWVRNQSTRQRDAVYGYLSVVFEIVQRWRMLGHTGTFSRHALTATKTVARSEPETLLPSLFFVHLILRWWMPGLEANGQELCDLRLELSPLVSHSTGS